MRDRQWPRAAVFDCDGLLLDTGAAWRSAYEATLEPVGRGLDAGALAALNGASVRRAASHLGVPAARLRDRLDAAVLTAPTAVMPGARALLDVLHRRLPLAVATNGPGPTVTSALRAAGLAGYFDAIVSAEDQPKDKPAPDVYLAACRALGVHPSDAIAFEDSTVGVTAARRAGLVVVYVPSNASKPADADLRVTRLDDPSLLALLGTTAPQVPGAY